MSAYNFIPLLEVDFKNSMRCKMALKWVIPGLLENFASLFTAKVMSGLVQHDTYNKAPMIDL